MDATQWEYEVYVTRPQQTFMEGPKLAPDLKQALNYYGAQGWELVSIFDVNQYRGGSAEIVATFKRPLPPTPNAPKPPPLPKV